MSLFTQEKKWKLLLTFVTLVCVVCTPLSQYGTPKKAEAQFGGLSPGIVVKDIGNTLTNTIQTLSSIALEQKELILDGLFREIAQKALQKMTGDIIKWVNSGFDGNPAFVTDLSGFLQEVADDVAGEFIYGDALSSLCSPFQLDVRIVLAELYQEENYGGFKKQAQCTIDYPGVDIEVFLGGDFDAGGWNAWFETVLNPVNTPMGALTKAKGALRDKAAEETENANQEIANNNGFLSLKSCVTVGTGSQAKKKCSVTTPGIVIQQQLSAALNAPLQSLLNADEFNEVVGALFGNLAQQAITGVNGLLGLGGNATFSANTFGAGGNLSYLDAVRQESAQQKLNTTKGNKIQQALNTEEKALQLQLKITEEIDSVLTFYEDSRRPYVTNTCWDLAVPTELTTIFNDVVRKVPTTVSTIVVLQDLSRKFASSTDAEVQLELMQQFTALQSEGLLTGQTAVIEYEYFIQTELKAIIAELKKNIELEKKSCS